MTRAGSATRPPSAKVSPTAYATGNFWVRHGLSHPALRTREGDRLERVFRLMIAGTQRFSGVSIEAMMLARHRGIDAVLTRAIEDGRVTQVIELAAGLSPRGWSFKQRFGSRITYVETDLPVMAALKRRLLEDGGLLSAGHRVVELDALASSGENSLAGVAATLDPGAGTAVITEGLMNYLDPDTARGVWRRIAGTLRRFPRGLYLSDLYVRTDHRSPAVAVFGALLSAFVRGRMHVHFKAVDQAVRTMKDCGFRSAATHAPTELPGLEDLAGRRGADRVWVLDAAT